MLECESPRPRGVGALNRGRCALRAIEHHQLTVGNLETRDLGPRLLSILGAPRRIAGERIDHFGVAPVSVWPPNHLNHRVTERERVDLDVAPEARDPRPELHRSAQLGGVDQRRLSLATPDDEVRDRCPRLGKHSDVHIAHGDLASDSGLHARYRALGHVHRNAGCTGDRDPHRHEDQRKHDEKRPPHPVPAWNSMGAADGSHELAVASVSSKSAFVDHTLELAHQGANALDVGFS